MYYPPRGYVPVKLFDKDYAWSIIFSNLESLELSQLEVRVVAMDDVYLKTPAN